MAADGASGAAAAWGIKSGAAAVGIAMLVSLVAVVVGFTVVPLTKGQEGRDAGRRLAAGLLSSFILGPMVASKAIDLFPWLMAPWVSMLKDQHILWAYLATAAPFIALSGLLGFWIVAAVMLFFTRRRGRDALQLAQELRDQITPGPKP